MKSGKYIKDRLYSVCIFVAMLIISVLMMAAFKEIGRASCRGRV